MRYSILKNSEKLSENFTVTAHTGCHKTADNSLESIERAISSGADVTEFDLRFSSDGRGILAHDEGTENPVTLDEAFVLIATDSKIRVNVDCKTTDNLKEVYLLSEKYGITDRIFYTGIEEKDVEAVKEQTPEIAYYLNYSADIRKKSNEEYIKELISLVKEKGAAGLNISFTQCSKKMVEMFRKEGLLVSVWTANNEAEMLMCLSMLPDNITTRYPETLLELIK